MVYNISHADPNPLGAVRAYHGNYRIHGMCGQIRVAGLDNEPVLPQLGDRPWIMTSYDDGLVTGCASTTLTG